MATTKRVSPGHEGYKILFNENTVIMNHKFAAADAKYGWFKIHFPNYKKAPVFKDSKLTAAPVEAPKVIEYKHKMPKAT